MINSIPKFRAEELKCYNYHTWLKPHISPEVKNFSINAGHVFQFECFSSWRGRASEIVEPFKVLVSEPIGSP